MSNKCELAFVAIAVRDGVGYASDYDKNGLYKVNMETGDCEFLDVFEDQPMNKKRLHSCAKWIENKIYFIPDSANRIAVYDLGNGNLESISIFQEDVDQYAFYKRNFNFIDAIEYNGFLWMFPCTYPGVLRLDLYTNEIKRLDNWVNNTEYYFRAKLCLEESKVIIPNGIGNEVLVFDLEKECGKLIRIGHRYNGAMCIRKIGDDYWLAPRNQGAIVSWNRLTNKIKEYDVYPNKFEIGKVGFSNIYRYKDDIIVSPLMANMGLVLTKGRLEEEKSIEWKQDPLSSLQYLFETELYYYYRELSDKNRSRYFRVNKCDNTVSDYKFHCLIRNEMKKTIIQKFESNKIILEEGLVINLQDFIKNL